MPSFYSILRFKCKLRTRLNSSYTSLIFDLLRQKTARILSDAGGGMFV